MTLPDDQAIIQRLPELLTPAEARLIEVLREVRARVQRAEATVLLIDGEIASLAVTEYHDFGEGASASVGEEEVV